MAPPRHRLERPTRTSRLARLPRGLRLVVPAAAAVTVAGTTAVVAWPEDVATQSTAALSVASAPRVVSSPVPVRQAPISRSEERVRLEPKPPKAVDHMFATAEVSVRAKPSKHSRQVDVLDRAERIGVSGETEGAWVEVVVDQEARWVHGAFLADRRPRPEPEPEPEPEPVEETAEPEAAEPVGLSTAPCPTGSEVESGLAANAVAVHRAVCAAYPQVSSYGGVRADSGEHGTGHALDVMISGSTGDSIAEYVRAHAAELGVSEVIWAQKIWTVERSSEGWRWMEDRGSSTANHYDHVHVTVH